MKLLSCLALVLSTLLFTSHAKADRNCWEMLGDGATPTESVAQSCGIASSSESKICRKYCTEERGGSPETCKKLCQPFDTSKLYKQYVCGTTDKIQIYYSRGPTQKEAANFIVKYCKRHSSQPSKCRKEPVCVRVVQKEVPEEKIALIGITDVERPNPPSPPPVITDNEDTKPAKPKPVHKQCENDSHCPGFANQCFAGRCTQPGFQCENDSQCPGFANYCFAGKCNKQEALCDSDTDCPGFANSCFAGKCTNP